MKKLLTIGLALLLVISVVAGAYAFGPGTGRGMGQQGNAATLTPEQAQKFAQFQKDILPLRQKMMQLRTELMTLRTQSTPDWKAIGDLQKQMVDVRIEIQKKRAEAGLGTFGPGACRGGKTGKRGMGPFVR